MTGETRSRASSSDPGREPLGCALRVAISYASRRDRLTASASLVCRGGRGEAEKSKSDQDALYSASFLASPTPGVGVIRSRISFFSLGPSSFAPGPSMSGCHPRERTDSPSRIHALSLSLSLSLFRTRACPRCLCTRFRVYCFRFFSPIAPSLLY